MIFGNPFKFAVQIEHIPEWSSSYLEGIFLIYIDGLIVNADIRSETLDIQSGFLSAGLLAHSRTNKHFAELPVKSLNFEDDQLYTYLNNLTFPKSIDTDQCFDYIIWVHALLDRGIELYAFNKEGVDYLFVVQEKKGLLRKVAVDVGECCQIAQNAEAYITDSTGSASN